MLKGLFLVAFLSVNILIGFSSIVSYATTKPSKTVCIGEYKAIWKKYNKDILDDIVVSYGLSLENSKELTMNDLSNKMRIGEKNEDIRSLLRLFEGNSLGDKRLFLKDNKGIFLYKRTDGKNILKILEKESVNGKWTVTNTKEIEGKIIKWEKFDWSKCKEN
jgi:hypothetical protein